MFLTRLKGRHEQSPNASYIMKQFLVRAAGTALAIGVLGGATLVYAQTPTPSAIPTPTVSSRPTPKTVDLVCMQTAVEKRDNAIIAAADAYYATVKIALTTRRDALKAAFGITDKTQRRTTIRNAWNTYKSAHRKAKSTLTSTKNAAWRQFNTDRKACGPGAASEDATPSGVDAQL